MRRILFFESRIWLVVLALTAAVFAAYFNALNVGFYGDDWIFYDLAGRLSLHDYLVRYFDPNAQTAWYRPVQGMLFRIEHVVFGANTLLYHLRNLLFHLGNCFWLFAIVARVSSNRITAFAAALIFATLPTAAIAVFWPGVVDPMLAFFFLASVWFWLKFLESARTRDYGFAFSAFLLALLSKEIAVSLPVVLFLLDRLMIAQPMTWRAIVRRYVWFGVAFVPYALIEFIVTRRSVFVNREGYTASVQFATNLLDYLSTLAFPWAFIPALNYALLLIAGALVIYFVFVHRVRALIPPIVGAVIAVLPVVPFPFVTNRFLYLPLIVSAILYAFLFDLVARRIFRGAMSRLALGTGLAGIALFGGITISESALAFGENARVARVPFRNVRQAHPTFPENTLLYFIYPPVPGPNLSGMFLWHYGPRVFAGANDSDVMPRLRDYSSTYVYYFDNGNQKEQRVENEPGARLAPLLPVTFAQTIQLDKVELVSANVKRRDAILLLLQWRALAPMTDDYTVTVRLVDKSGTSVTVYEKEPRRGNAPTSTWMPGQIILDAIQLPVPADASSGVYRLELALVDAGKQTRLGISNSSNNTISLEPISVK